MTRVIIGVLPGKKIHKDVTLRYSNDIAEPLCKE